MINPPPLRDQIPSPAWDNWFNQISEALRGIRQTLTASAPLNFGLVSAQSQVALTIPVKGASVGDAVSVAPASDVAGIIFSGSVTAADVVTVYAKNFSSSAIDPSAQNFRINIIKN